jgi:hypothetical protein
MTRRRKKKTTGEDVALFPFLAVLICTMGSLIVLLVVLVQQARVYAESQVADDASAHQQRIDELNEQKKIHDARLETLTPIYDKSLRQLDEKRLELGHLEDHITRLEARWKTLGHLAKQTRDLSQQDSSDHEFADEQLAIIREEMAANRRLIESLEGRLARRKRSFAIIPYDGANGTRRRPIFVECTGDEIILHPEGVKMSLDDFSGPVGFGPGNVLASALRTVREHYAKTTGGEAYPLLVIRPSGVEAYAAARHAMTSWQDEFGYELVSADKNLKYPPPDAMLADKIHEAVERARNRQELLAAAMPGGFSGRQARYVVKRRGGLQRIDGRPVSSQRRSTGMENTEVDRDKADSGKPTGRDAKPQSQAGANGQPRAAAISNQRAENWGLPNANPDSQGFTRPVRVVLTPDSIMIMPPKGHHFRPITTTLAGPMSREDSQRFVAKLWKHMESWGIAADGGYWVPTLSVEVHPGGEQQYQRFSQLFSGSGIPMQRKAP